MTIAPGAVNDRLARLLAPLRMSSTFYGHTELSEPWSLKMPAIADAISFHVVTAGDCWVSVPGSDPTYLRAGDLALVPHGRGHGLSSSPDLPAGPRVDLLPQEFVSPQYSRMTYGGGGRRAELICGIVGFDDAASRELMRSLPRLLFVGGDTAASSVHMLVRLIAEELSRTQPGGAAVATRLADVLIVEAIRHWLAHSPETGAGWLRGMQDERIGRALEAVHDEPGRAWDLPTLARVATMSRSTFSERFTALVGVAPGAYVTRWRMNVAQQRLAQDGVTVARLAGELGYQSEAAFHRAFVRVVGVAPGVFRRSVNR